MIESCEIVLDKRVRAIVQFGPPTQTSGFRPAEYFQVTIDPNMVSPKGDYIRFGLYPGDEIVGWQRVEAMTVCEVLGDGPTEGPGIEGYEAKEGAEVTMKAIK